MRAASFGDSDPGPVQVLTIGHEPGPVLEVLDLGATVHRLLVTGGDGVRRNVVLGHATPQEHLDSTHYLGGTIGRYANRIREGRLPLDGREVQLGVHDRGNHLHGGPDGFDRRIWEVREHTDDVLELGLTSPDGDQGFPGEVQVTARFETGPDGVRLLLGATTDAPTVVNLTSHVYLNLAGEGGGTVDDHLLQVPADRFDPVDGTGIPLGPEEPVDGTPFDLRAPRRVGDVARDPHPQVVASQGIDHDLHVSGEGLRTVAVLEDPGTRTRLELRSDQPALQVYLGNGLDGTLGSTRGGRYRQGDGLALEPQLPPDSPHRPAYAEAAVLRPGERYRSTIEWRFGATQG